MIPNLPLDFPNFSWRQNARKRRILAETLGLIRLGAQKFANAFQWLFEDALPFHVTAKERRAIGILTRPPRQVSSPHFDQFGCFTQTAGDPASQFQADRVISLVIHASR